MCGRYTLNLEPAELQELFGAAAPDGLAPRFNIAPSQAVLIVRETGDGREAALVRWGFQPPRAAKGAVPMKMINARAETVFDKPAYRAAAKARRCLVPADGFFEWKRVGKRKQPYHIHRADGRPFAMAGIWEKGRDADGNVIETCSILTTDANAVVAKLHNRMPVILRDGDYGLWLDMSVRERGPLEHLFEPLPVEVLVATPVSTLVNDPKNDNRALIAEVEPMPEPAEPPDDQLGFKF